MEALFTQILNFIPVVNVATDIFAPSHTTLGPFFWKMVETVYFLQFLIPYLEKLTRLTSAKWDDHLLAKIGVVCSWAVEVVAALGAADPKIAKRLKGITRAGRIAGRR